MYLWSQPSQALTRRYRGFTITEMVLAIFLTALLAVLLAAAVATFARPAAEVDGRTRLALEASVAVESMARDLSGYLADNSGVPGTLTQYQFNNWIRLVRRYNAGSQLSRNPPRAGIRERDLSTAELSTRPHHGQRCPDMWSQSIVTGFNVAYCDQNGSPDTSGSNVRIEMTFTYPDPSSPRQSNPSFSGTFILVGVPPPPCAP